MIVRVFRTLKHHCHRRKGRETEHQRNEKMMARWTRRLGIFTIILALIAAGTAWILWETEDTNRISSRPYISGVGLIVDNERVPLFWVVKVILENSGGTPPLELRYVIRSSADFPLDPDEIFHHPSETDAFFEQSVAPKNQIQVQAGMPLAAFFDSRRAWYVSGAIHYRDQFHGTPEHVSKFCYALLAARNYKINTSRPGYDACLYWNCIDERACDNDRARYDAAVRSGAIRPTKKSTDVPEIPIGTGLPSPQGVIIRTR